jgi:hypothetical protein
VVGQLWSGVAGKLAERWIAQSIPAFLYWLAAWCAWEIGGGSPVGSLTHRFDGLSGGAKILAVALGLAAIGASTGLVDRLVLPVTRLLEGYWPAWAAAGWARLGARLGARFGWSSEQDRMKALTTEYLRLAADPDRWQAQLVAVQQQLRRYPVDPGRVMPTALGNVLRAMEDRPRVRYGLETVLVWPHLWFGLADGVRTDIAAARAALDRSVAAVIWGAATVLLLVFTPWALLPAIIIPIVAYRAWVLPSAVSYADLISAAFDLYRLDLYRQLRLEPPKDAAAEPEQGTRLSQYLLSGRSPGSGFAPVT